jgi:hypothetical protein
MGIVVKVGFTQSDYLYLFVKERAKSIPNSSKEDSHRTCKLEKLGFFFYFIWISKPK